MTDGDTDILNLLNSSRSVMEKVMFTPCSCVLWEVLQLGVISYRQAFKVTNQSDLFGQCISKALSALRGPK